MFCHKIKHSGIVYTDTVSFAPASLSMRLRLSFPRRRSRPQLKPGRFENAVKKWSVFKTMRYVGHSLVPRRSPPLSGEGKAHVRAWACRCLSVTSRNFAPNR